MALSGNNVYSIGRSLTTHPHGACQYSIQDNQPANFFSHMQSLLCGREAVHKIPRAAEIPNLDLYMTDLSDSTQEAERLPHPTMSLFMRPELRKYPKLAAGRVVVKEKAAPTNPPATARSPQNEISDDIAQLKKSMAQAKNDKLENGCVVLSRLWKWSELTCTPVVRRSSILPYPA